MSVDTQQQHSEDSGNENERNPDNSDKYEQDKRSDEEHKQTRRRSVAQHASLYQPVGRGG